MQSLQLQALRLQSSPETAPPHVVHQLKEWPSYFADLIEGRPFELRKADRPFKRGDGIRVTEWDPNAGAAGAATGRTALVRITWTSDEWRQPHLLPTDVVILGVELLELNPRPEATP